MGQSASQTGYARMGASRDESDEHTVRRQKPSDRLKMSPELAAIALVYFAQGVAQLTMLAQTYHFREELGASPATADMIGTLAFLPWTLKPLYGFVTDTIPMFGYRRRSYLMVAGVLDCLSWLLLAVLPSHVGLSTVLLVLHALCSAMTDVVVDAIVVERSRGQSQARLGDLQSLCWGSYAIGQLITANCSGWMVRNFGPRVVFGIASVAPMVVVAATFQIREVQLVLVERGVERLQAMWTEIRNHGKQFVTALSHSQLLWPLLFLFLLTATPSSDPAMVYFLTERLGFGSEFQAKMQIMIALATVAGILVFNLFLKKVPMSGLFLVGVVACTLAYCTQLMLVTGLHTAMGFGNESFTLGSNALINFFVNVLSMPQMVLASRMCPEGMEATFFATIMSIMNVGSTLGLLSGAALAQALHITSSNFTALPLLVIICDLAMLSPLLVLPLIPSGFVTWDDEDDIEVIDGASLGLVSRLDIHYCNWGRVPKSVYVALGGDEMKGRGWGAADEDTPLGGHYLGGHEHDDMELSHFEDGGETRGGRARANGALGGVASSGVYQRLAERDG